MTAYLETPADRRARLAEEHTAKVRRLTSELYQLWGDDGRKYTVVDCAPISTYVCLEHTTTKQRKWVCGSLLGRGSPDVPGDHLHEVFYDADPQWCPPL